MITIKEEWLLHEKTQRAIAKGGHEVVTLWLAIKRYCACNLTDGFVPDEDIECLPGAPAKARKALKALVECGSLGRDGIRGSGLVDPAPGGWQLHDYDDHSKSREEIELAREKARVKKERQRQAAREELGRLRGQTGDRSTSPPRAVPPPVPGPVPGGHPTKKQKGQPGNEDEGLVYARDPQPNPAQPSQPAGRLADRVACLPREAGHPPSPRRDPINERIPLGRWFPSQEILDWTTESGLSAEGFDAVMVDVRDKLQGLHDIEWWDTRILKFFGAAVDRARREGVPSAPGHATSAPNETEAAEAAARAEEAYQARQRAHGAERLRKFGVVPDADTAEAS